MRPECLESEEKMREEAVLAGDDFETDLHRFCCDVSLYDAVEGLVLCLIPSLGFLV
jgi:hypothetical protein